jgi:hypothetical protein
MQRRTAFRIVLGVAVLTLAIIPPAAFAGRGGGKPGGGGTTSGGGTISLAPIVTDLNGNGLPNFRDTIMFNVSTTSTTQPYVDLQCFQNGVMVAEGWRGYFDGALDTRFFTLASPQWPGGAADCIAYLTMPTSKGSMQRLASTSFHVGA